MFSLKQSKRFGLKSISGALIVTAVVAAAVIGISKAYLADDSPVVVHQVDESPEEMREFWTPERLEDAKGDPMPNIVED